MLHSHQHFDLLDKIVMERVIFTPPLNAGQVMEDEACFVYSVNGQSTMYGGKDRNFLAPGVGALVKCGNFINHWKPVDHDEPCEAVAIHVYPEVINYVYQDKVPTFLKQSTQPSGKHIARLEANDAITNYVDSLRYYFDNPAMVDEDLIVLKIKELILLLVNAEDPHIKSLLSDMFNPEVIEFKSLIEQNLFEELSIDEFALLTHQSSSSFKRKFDEVFGESPGRYIKKKRLERAAELLSISKSTISEICFECGFNDLAHFSKSFSAQFGVSPSAYRDSIV